MPHQVTINNLPLCCGAFMLQCFYQNPDPVERGKYLKDGGYSTTQIENYKRSEAWETTEEYLKRIEERLDYYTSAWKGQKCYIMAILNEQEEKILGSLMLKKGFEVLIPKMKNSSGSSIVTYVFYLTKKPDSPEPAVKPKSIVGRSVASLRRGS